jgi:hypothetical protein
MSCVYLKAANSSLCSETNILGYVPTTGTPDKNFPLQDTCHVVANIHFDKYWHAVAQLAEALRYIPEGRGLDSRLRHWNFSMT